MRAAIRHGVAQTKAGIGVLRRGFVRLGDTGTFCHEAAELCDPDRLGPAKFGSAATCKWHRSSFKSESRPILGPEDGGDWQGDRHIAPSGVRRPAGPTRWRLPRQRQERSVRYNAGTSAKVITQPWKAANDRTESPTLACRLRELKQHVPHYANRQRMACARARHNLAKFAQRQDAVCTTACPHATQMDLALAWSALLGADIVRLATSLLT